MLISSEAVRKTQRALGDPRPERCFDALAALGWDQDNATVVWRSTSEGGLGQCHIGPYPTGASVARQPTHRPARTTLEDNRDWWKAPYYGDYRWCIEFEHGRIRYCDLLAREECDIPAGDLSVDLLEGLTPTYFAHRGLLTPVGVVRRSLPGLAGQRAAHEFCTKMKLWFHDYLSLGGNEEPKAKEDFTRFLSAFILLRTIEDVERLDWLERRTLLQAARAGENATRSLLKRAATELNSRILHGVADLLPAEERVRSLVEAFYGEDLDFATLEADPVGQFYQNVLGTQYDLQIKSQRHLFGENLDVFPDRSVRKKRGAYFTPREYADLLARRLVLPAVMNARTVDELPVVLDLAVGSGQLLCAALRQIFSLPRWRRPETALHVLDRCMWAVDIDPNAPQLAALNVLRTTVQLVPEILGSGLKFPSLLNNFIKGDALKQSTIDKLPEVDVVLLNPPFHGAKSWSAPKGVVKAVKPLERHAHSAFAFCMVGLQKLRPGGEIGILLPAQPIRGPQSRSARAIIAKQLCVETVLINEVAEAFDRGDRSYTSVVLGYKSYGDERPRTQIITVAGEKGADLGALAAGAWNENSPARAELLMIPAERPWDWTAEERAPGVVGGSRMSASSEEPRVPRVRLSELLGGGIHQPVSCAPKPWKRDLFLFEVVRPNCFRHLYTRVEIAGTSPLLRRVAIPNYMLSVPPLLAPKSGRSGGLRVFYPAEGAPEGLRWRELRRSDPVGYEIAKLISDTVLETNLSESLNKDARKLRASLEQEVIRISWNRGYGSDPRPLLLLSQGANPPATARNGLVWSSWIDTSGEFVPMGGNWVRVPNFRWALGLAVLLNVQQAVIPLLRNAPKRQDGTTQPHLKAQNSWAVPDLRDSRCNVLLDELEIAFESYRGGCVTLSRDEALQRPEWEHLLELGKALWML